MTSTMSEKGQVTISKEIRDELGIGHGWRAQQCRVGDHVEIRFLPPRHRRSLRGALADGTRRSETEEDFSRASEAAWVAGAHSDEQP